MRLQRWDRVRSAGLFGTVIDPEAGTTTNPGVTGGRETLAQVNWDDQEGTALVRVSMLTVVPPKRKPRPRKAAKRA